MIGCESCGQTVRRIPEVGDVWLDAGIVPFSTLGWQNPTWVEAGYATGASRGLSRADLPDHAYWEQWFPADWVSEMREQIRLWFYSMLFMSVAITGRAPFTRVLGHEKMLDERGREMHGSWGNVIEAEDAFSRMGADVMRWQYCAQPPRQDLWFGFGPGHEIKRNLLTFWNSASFFIEYANIAAFRPSYADLVELPQADLRPLDRWLVARTQQLVLEATQGYEATMTAHVLRAFQDFVDDLSNWYIRRSRRRFWEGDEQALRTLWFAVVHSLRVVAPIIPLLTEHLWQNLVANACEGAPDSVFLAGWAERQSPDAEIRAEVDEVRRVVELGRQARAQSKIKVRQPLRQAYVRGARLAARHAYEIRDELRVKRVGFDDGPLPRVAVRPNLRVLGPRLGPKIVEVRRALEAGDYRELPDGRIQVAGLHLAPDEVLRDERMVLEGWASVSDGAISVVLDTDLDDELRLEGRVFELVRKLNERRRALGLELTDRVHLRLPAAMADLLRYADWIRDEVLAESVQTDDAATEPVIVKAGEPGA